MSRPRNPDAAGFTLLECEVALLVLGLVILGLLRATSDHERLLNTLDDLPGVESVRWVRPTDDALARALGRPAALHESEPGPPAPDLADDLLGPAAPEGAVFEVLDVGRDLSTRRSWALVRVERAVVPDADDGDDDAPGDDAKGGPKGRGRR